MKTKITLVHRLLTTRDTKPWWRSFGVFLLIYFNFLNFASAQHKVWDKTYGGSEEDEISSIEQTRDGGFILGGTSRSGKGGDRTSISRGDVDYWVVKLNADGTKAWDNAFGGKERDELKTVQQTPDGGYILGGTSASPISGVKSQASFGPNDYWLVKLNANGVKMWDRTFGGSDIDRFSSLVLTNDGGFLLGGTSNSPVSGSKSDPDKGGKVASYDFWIVKVNADGSKAWDKTFGGNSYDGLLSLQKTSDGGYILGGESYSGISGDKTQASKGDEDYWVIKINADGNKEWDKTFGGNSSDTLFSLVQTQDGGYILGGTSYSDISGDKSEAKNGYMDYWVIKLKADGTKVWDKTLGGNAYEGLTTVLQTTDGGYLIGGSSNSDASGDKREGNQGLNYYTDESPIYDYWIVKLNANGSKAWDKTIGSEYDDKMAAAIQLRDGHYVLAGASNSGVKGDKSETSRGSLDYWIVKLDNNINTGKEQAITFKNIPNQDIATASITLQATSTSGLPVSFTVVSGPAKIKNNQLTFTGLGLVTVKASQAGNATYDAAREIIEKFEVYNLPITQVWNKTYGGVVTITPQAPESDCNDFGTSIFTTMVASADGGYLLGGSSDSKKGGDKSENLRGPERFCAYPYPNEGYLDYWVVKVDANGHRLWDKTFGGDGWEELAAMVATPDGGFLLAGNSNSGKTGDKSEACASANSCFDYWIVRIDAQGNKLWDKSLRRQFGRDRLKNLIIGPDGGFLLNFEDGDLGRNTNLVLKLDAAGKQVWGIKFSTVFSSLLATADGGYILGGAFQETNSGTKEPKYLGQGIMKIDANGHKLWNKIYKGGGVESLVQVISTLDGGYLLGWTSQSGAGGDKSEGNKGLPEGNFVTGDYWVLKVDATGKKQWDKTIGGNSWDILVKIAATADGGYLLGGNSRSGIYGDKSEANRGGKYEEDYWVVKLDGAGQKLWDKTFGGTGHEEEFKALIANPDNSYLIGGVTDSPAGVDRAEELKGLKDYWIIKIKDKTPLVASTWNMRYGGSGTDNLTSVIKTQDGGYLSGGYTNSGAIGDKTQISQGKNDYWIVKSDKNGKKQWDKRFGGYSDDYLNTVIQTQDGGYLLAGSSYSQQSGDKSQVSRGGRDYWIVKTDAQGNKLWDQRYGGTGDDELKKVIQLASGRYLLAGSSNSPQSGDKSQAGKGGQDYWVLKINPDGQKVWDRSYGGSADDILEDLALAPDGNLLVGGSSQSSSGGDRTQGNRGMSDFWVVRLGGNGEKIWDRRFGGSRDDKLMALGTTPTGNLYLAGTTASQSGGDLTYRSRGLTDYWLLEITSTGTKVWDRLFGGNLEEELRAVQVTNDGNYLLAGTSRSGKWLDKTQDSQGGSDYWVVEANRSGVVQDKRYGGSQDEELRAMVLTNDGGYLLAGRSISAVSGDRTQPSQGVKDYWLVKGSREADRVIANRTAFEPEASVTPAELTTLLAYPNPFQKKVTVRFTLPETQAVILRVLDSQGRVITTLGQEEAQANQPYELEWQASKQEAGMYLLQLQTPTHQYTQKLLLTK
ncbi:T9SS type A sorting domain-containing protein [Adhaeribacter pallidiroseus]|uniref:Secretion system C-terminal sorting domain-containing protein n=1 Tax=Adhaeribacter pallidiroseus TaxID=2072847 RepID=A0A369QNW6_9BACT|nr:T9SS type A sorting domain-containing protein [Adhaeribacter pallidiroseus]RDC63908.1 hypothetical protein AHMF7616_02517 [Adhaeribacter pallidiroseus]